MTQFLLYSARKIRKEDAVVNWSQKTAEEVFNLHRALSHIYRLSTSWFDHTLKLVDVELDNVTEFDPANKAAIDKLGSTNAIIPGLVEFSHDRSLLRVQCKDGRWVTVKAIVILGKPCGKSPFTAFEFYCQYVEQVENTLDRRFGS